MSIREQERTLVVANRFQGLPEVAHGGYLAGLLAGALDADGIEVRLRRPVETGRQLSLERCAAGGAELRDGETVLATAAPATLAIDVPPPVSAAEAATAAQRFLGRDEHPIPGCVVCGTARAAGDGLRVFPGPVAGRRLVAAPWVPPAESDGGAGAGPVALGSAALDCTQLWALIAHAPAGTSERAVTAELSLQLASPLRPGEPHVVIGWPIERGRRAWVAGAAVLGPDGEVCLAGHQRAAVTNWGVPLGRPRTSAQDQPNHDSRRDR
jgi:hypothetical protein